MNADRAVAAARRVALRCTAPVARRLHERLLIEGTRGWLSRDEARLLRTLAEQTPAGTCIVEVGSYHGRSTIALALGARRAGVRLYAIEPHERFVTVSGEEAGGGHDRVAFFRNLLRSGLVAHVRLVNLTSRAVTGDWQQPVGLLWIDGSHRYEAVRDDLEAWEPYLAPGARVALHDTRGGFEGPTRLVAELVDAGRYEVVDEVGSTSVLLRR